jgi:hypothetical protein
MAITKTKFFIFFLLMILIAINSTENELFAQENGKQFLHLHEPSVANVNESEGVVKHDAIIDTVHIASYVKNDKRITDSVQRRWIYGRNNLDVDHQSGEIDSSTSLRLQEDKNTPFFKEEKSDGAPAGRKWNLTDTRKLKPILDLSLFPNATNSAASDSIFNETSLLDIANQNDDIGSTFKTNRPFMNSAIFSLLAAERTEQEYFGAPHFYNDTTSYNQMDSGYNVKIFTIDTQGHIEGITGKILTLFP